MQPQEGMSTEHATTWTNLKDILLSERSQHKDHTAYDSTYVKRPQQENP